MFGSLFGAYDLYLYMQTYFYGHCCHRRKPIKVLVHVNIYICEDEYATVHLYIL